ncbi:Aste57867_22989 [Aphanomyces stellatus]|uniref:Aste57867_22989 protein n=1 Tax=Aphanomyces stellatus TaxID=120398 RepID=A0A485LLN5_9STRA|nr:hypothetical protein As57867_022918 [Aphanomyces stellatus]VFT99638.1 Aste57867_22989 [Aphanomyces stellatus]
MLRASHTACLGIHTRAPSHRTFSSWNSGALSRQVRKKRDKALLFDGNNLLYDVYDPRDQLSWNDAPVGSAVRFVQRVREIVHAKQAARLAIFFDTPMQTQRQVGNTNYKPSHRKRVMPNALRAQFPTTIQVLKELGLPVIQVPGVEADDLIASYSKASVTDGYDVMIVTNDTDLYQLVQSTSRHDEVEQNVSVYRPMRRQSIREAHVTRFLGGAHPRQQPEIRALCGDARGKTPGIPGGMTIQEAVGLLESHGGLVRLLRNLNEVNDKQLSQRLQRAISMLEQSYRASKLNENVALPLPTSTLSITQPVEYSRAVLDRHFGPDGTAIVFTAQAKLPPKHLVPRQPKSSDVDGTIAPEEDPDTSSKE